MSTDPFSHPWLSGLFKAPDIEPLWSTKAQIDHLIEFEIAWTQGLATIGHISESEAKAALLMLAKWKPDYEKLKSATALDGVVIPELVQQITKDLVAPQAVHTGATSQDVIDSALALTLREISAKIISNLSSITTSLIELSQTHGRKKIMGKTRMQDALLISVSHKIQTWIDPLIELGCEGKAHKLPIQIGGAVGDNQALKEQSEKMTLFVSDKLNLPAQSASWHTNRNKVVSFAGWITRISGILGKMGQDICLMAQNDTELILRSGGRSSVMAHKQNPVLGELIITLARFNAGQVGLINQCMIHEQERSGSAWMLEWMVLPQMTMVTDCSMHTTGKLLKQIESIGR